jgi:hypothetical protein
MVSLDYWSDAELNRDGAVLQYSIDGGENWELVGPLSGGILDQGINWYNSLGIVGEPGNQRAAGDYGWSGRSSGWRNARFHLDMIDPAKREQVRLRVAFGSEDNNDDTNGKWDGFAFDNIFVGDKTRNVLVEHFTSVDGGSRIANEAINDLYDAQVAERVLHGGASDFQNIQYHISSATSNPLNKDNEIDPAARSLFMSVSSPPTTIMDGLRSPKLTGSYRDITKIEIDRRALVDPAFLMTLDTVQLDPGTVARSNNKIKPVITLTAQRAFTSPLLLNIALVEDVGSNRNVLRKLLFGPEGLTIANVISKGDVINRDKDIIELNAPILNPNGLTMIAFIQDRTTREIYQSVVLKAPYKIGSAIIGLEEELTETAVITSKIGVYPNPASGRFNFNLPASMTNGDNYKWKMADQRGVIVREGDFSGALGGQLEVDITPFANAMYIIVIEGPDKSVAYHKLMVLNRP